MEEEIKEGSISTVEELNPEPEGKDGRPGFNFDLILGLLLLAGLLALALWMWWHDTDASQHYQQAQQAASARHWDEALANFSAASGYKDADLRAADAAGQIKKRDSQYQMVISYTRALNKPEGASPEQAVAALLAARSIQAIEPAYKDTEATITRSEDQLFTDALSGTIVLREQAEPPGLYYRGPGGWLYMQGSDKESRVLDTVGETFIAYDAPASYKAPARSSTLPVSSTQAPGGLQDRPERRFVLAKLSDNHKEASFQSLKLTPNGENIYVFGERGVWALSRYGSPADGPGIGVNLNYNSNSFSYEPFGGTPVTGTVALTALDSRILDLGRKGSKMLIAASEQVADNGPTNRIYVAGPDGGNPTAIYSTTGMLLGASLSPDEQYALVVSAEQDGTTPERVLVTANLLNLRPNGQAQGKSPPVNVAQTEITGNITSSDTVANLRNEFHVGGIFLDDGTFRNQLLLGWVDGNSIRLRLADPSNAEATLAETSVGYLNTPYYKAPVNMQAIVQSDGRTLLVYDASQQLRQASSAPGELFSTLVKVFRVQGQTGNIVVSDFAISLPPEDVPNDQVPYLSDVVFSDAGPVIEITTGLDHFVYGLSASTIAMPTLFPPMRVITSPLYSAQTPGSPVYWLKGPRALAYIDNNSVLHVRAYSAETDVTLENGVSSIVNSHTRYLSNSVIR